MSDETHQTPESKKPAFIACQMREGSNGKSYSTRVGVAWAHKKGGGFKAKLDAIPLSGEIDFFPFSEKPE